MARPCFDRNVPCKPLQNTLSSIVFDCLPLCSVLPGSHWGSTGSQRISFIFLDHPRSQVATAAYTSGLLRTHEGKGPPHPREVFLFANEILRVPGVFFCTSSPYHNYHSKKSCLALALRSGCLLPPGQFFIQSAQLCSTALPAAVPG